MEVGKIPETDADTESYPAIMRLVPMPSAQERKERLLRSLTPESQAVRALRPDFERGPRVRRPPAFLACLRPARRP